MAQALNIKWSMADDAVILQQKIDLHAKASIPQPVEPIAYIPEDARLRNSPPAKAVNEDMIRSMLSAHINRGLHLQIEHDMWTMAYGKKTDSGTMRMPPRVLLQCAEKVMQ